LTGPTLSLAGGGSATVVESDGHHAVLVASRAFAPGSPLEGTAEDGSGAYRLKVRGSRRIHDGHEFRVEGRWLNLTRRQREHLAAWVAAYNRRHVTDG
jgi:hypothetical protein